MMTSCKFSVISPFSHSFFGNFVPCSTAFGWLVLYLREREFGALIAYHV